MTDQTPINWGPYATIGEADDAYTTAIKAGPDDLTRHNDSDLRAKGWHLHHSLGFFGASYLIHSPDHLADGRYDDEVAGWLVKQDEHRLQVILGWIARAYAAGRQRGRGEGFYGRS